ncbi:hypothetical protein EVAR_80763_1 [Eumeta japonica]|uniref:Uncharacterized protein n=1 Tax=Eumeta variegata TaxID=151549 RepID=A0A4C1X6K8_EUMVA|nr:hypothetical protein EVAR_80763_1 [Eumeta japonica]
MGSNVEIMKDSDSGLREKGFAVIIELYSDDSWVIDHASHQGAGSTLTRQREARRLMRLRRDTSPPIATRTDNKLNPQQIDPAALNASGVQFTYPQILINLNDAAHAAAQKRALLELAWRTVALLQRNKLIQEKIIELQKETNEYVASVLQNPAELSLHLQNMGQYGASVARPAAASPDDGKTEEAEVEN